MNMKKSFSTEKRKSSPKIAESNTGANMPRTDGRKRSKSAKHCSAEIFVDYLSATHRADMETLDTCAQPLVEALALSGVNVKKQVRIVESEKGFEGWAKSAQIILVDGCGKHQIGLVAWSGGTSQRGRSYFCLTGRGTGLLTSNGFGYLTRFLTDSQGRITRIDVTLDDVEGLNTLGSVRNRYYRGQFQRGGRPPKKGEYKNNDASGNTFLIGSRAGGKLLRVYEKGKQLGDKSSPWLRFEVEFRARSDRPIPLEILSNPARYFIGSHKAFELMFGGREISPARLKSVASTTSIEVETMLKNLSNTAGAHVGLLLSMGVCGIKLLNRLARPFDRLEKRVDTSLMREKLTELNLMADVTLSGRS